MKISDGVGKGRKGTLVTLTARLNANKDTKNAINNHGPDFILVENWPDPEFCNWTRPDDILFRVADSKGWAGWLPINQIEIKK